MPVECCLNFLKDTFKYTFSDLCSTPLPAGAMSSPKWVHEIKLNEIDQVDASPAMPMASIARLPPVLPSSSSVRMIQQMTLAGSFLDFALFVADVEHLKFVLDAGKESIQYYTLLVILLCASLLLQLVAVLFMIIVGFKSSRPDTPKGTVRTARASSEAATNDEDTNPPSNGSNNGASTVLNHIIMALVTLIAIINVFITVFGDRSTAHLKEMQELERLRHLNHTTSHA